MPGSKLKSRQNLRPSAGPEILFIHTDRVTSGNYSSYTHRNPISLASLSGTLFPRFETRSHLGSTLNQLPPKNGHNFFPVADCTTIPLWGSCIDCPCAITPAAQCPRSAGRDLFRLFLLYLLPNCYSIIMPMFGLGV